MKGIALLRRVKGWLIGEGRDTHFERPNQSKLYQEWIAMHDTLSSAQRKCIAANIDSMSRHPLISILMPVFNPPVIFLKKAIESVRSQLYSRWELCIADDASTDVEVKELLDYYANLDHRIRVVCRTENGHISISGNSALEIAGGEFAALLDHDDVLAEHALYYIAKAIEEHFDVGVIYSDEDNIDDEGNRSNPHFKPDWNYELFLGRNLVSHLGVYRRSLLNEVGGFRPGFEGPQDYDLALRCIEHLQSHQIIHIPRILYHSRIHAADITGNLGAKFCATTSGLRAINDHFRRTCPGAIAELINEIDGYRVRFPMPEPASTVSIVIPTRNKRHLIQACIESILAKTNYPNYEIIVVDNNSDQNDALDYLRSLENIRNIKVMRDERPFNFSALNNRAVVESEAEFVLLLNNDIVVISPDWINELVSIAARPGVGAVGARLWYPDHRLQHGGVILGVGGVAGHAHLGLPYGDPGYFGRAALMQAMSAVTAACMLIRRSLYLAAGGLDEQNLAVSFNDVDFCLKVREMGYRNVWTPFAELYHHESASRGRDLLPDKRKRFKAEVNFMLAKWRDVLQCDPAYNPNLSLQRPDFSIAPSPRVPSHGQ